jgi:hypothetical protein
MISTHIKEFCEKIGPSWPNSTFKKKSLWGFLQQVAAGSQNMKGFLKLSTFISGL